MINDGICVLQGGGGRGHGERVDELPGGGPELDTGGRGASPLPPQPGTQVPSLSYSRSII